MWNSPSDPPLESVALKLSILHPDPNLFESTDVDAVRELLQYGLKETDSDVISCEGDEMARFIAEKVTCNILLILLH